MKAKRKKKVKKDGMKTVGAGRWKEGEVRCTRVAISSVQNMYVLSKYFNSRKWKMYLFYALDYRARNSERQHEFQKTVHG